MRLLIAASALCAASVLPPVEAGIFFGSTVCSECKCTEAEPFVINCTGLVLTSTYTTSDTWPSNKSDIHLLYGGNSLETVTSQPPIDVTELSFRSNSIGEIEDGAFEQLRRLRTLDLSRNKLTRISLTEHTFRGQFSADDYQPSPIESLDLSHNDIHSIFEETFSHLSSLRELDLSHNPLSLLDHHTVLAVTSLGRLQVLRLRSTGLLRLPHAFLHSLSRLQTLDLAHNRLRIVPRELHNSHAILSLSLDGNPIRSLDADSLRGMTHLETLNLSGMPLLESVDDQAFSTLTSLRVLRMRNNLRLHHISPHIFSGMDTSRGLLPLRELFISNSNLSTLEESTVPFWDQLLLLQLHDNPWRCDCNLQWMVDRLLPLLEETDQREATQVLCQQPAALRHVPVLRAGQQPGGLKCEPEPGPAPRHRRSGSGATLAAALTAGALVLLTGAAGLTYLAVRRSRIQQLYSARLWTASVVGTVLVMFVSFLFFWFIVAADRSGAVPPGNPFLLRLIGFFFLFLLATGGISFCYVRRQAESARLRAKQQIRYRRVEEESAVDGDDVTPSVTIRS